MILQIRKNFFDSNGFTMMELLVVVAVVVILLVASTPMYTGFQTSSQLNENVSQIIQTARIAKGRAEAGFNNLQHGIYFEINAGGDDKFILYQGSSYATRQTDYDRETILPSVLSLSSSDFVLTGGKDVDVNFSKGLGLPGNTGTITLTHGVKGSQAIIINSLGRVNEE